MKWGISHSLVWNSSIISLLVKLPADVKLSIWPFRVAVAPSVDVHDRILTLTFATWASRYMHENTDQIKKMIIGYKYQIIWPGTTIAAWTWRCHSEVTLAEMEIVTSKWESVENNGLACCKHSKACRFPVESARYVPNNVKPWYFTLLQEVYGIL
jgi:hypothetical protein